MRRQAVLRLKKLKIQIIAVEYTNSTILKKSSSFEKKLKLNYYSEIAKKN